VTVFVPPEVVFPDLIANERTLVQLLRELNRNETIIACCRANAAVSGYAGPDPKQQQEKMINDLLPAGSLTRINAFIAQSGLPYPPPVFFRGQFLELLRWTARHAANETANPFFYDDGHIPNREKFARAALICSVIWSRRIYADRLKSSGDSQLDRLRALGPFRKGIEESGQAPNQAQTLARGWLLFTKHMPERYPKFGKLFQEATSLTVEQYLIITVGLSVFTKADASQLAIFSESNMGGDSTYKDIIPKYLAIESQTADEIADGLWGKRFKANGYRALRDHIIIKGRDDRACVSDPTFLSEKISAGPLFHVTAAVRNDKGKGNEIFGAFGLAFEDYAGAMLDRMYPTFPGLFARLERNVKIGNRSQLEIDAVLNNVTDAILFEIKAAWLREDVILDDSPDELAKNLDKLYGVSKAKRERPKGVAQLARILNELLANPKAVWAQPFADVRVFYPVLLVHDVNLSAPTFGDFLNKRFQDLLSKSPMGKRVASLIIMTIDDLEKLETSVTNFALRDLLASYDSVVPDRIQTLHNFAIRSSFASSLIPNQSLIDTSTEVITNAIRELFPDFEDGPPPSV
jgi:hypothetical protein